MSDASQATAAKLAEKATWGNGAERLNALAELVRRAEFARWLQQELDETLTGVTAKWRERAETAEVELDLANERADEQEVIARRIYAEKVAAERERDEALRHLGGGEIPTSERIASCHSKLPIAWLGHSPGTTHAPYGQSHDEACFICALWFRAEAAEREATRWEQEAQRSRETGVRWAKESTRRKDALDQVRTFARGLDTYHTGFIHICRMIDAALAGVDA